MQSVSIPHQKQASYLNECAFKASNIDKKVSASILSA